MCRSIKIRSNGFPPPVAISTACTPSDTSSTMFELYFCTIFCKMIRFTGWSSAINTRSDEKSHFPPKSSTSICACLLPFAVAPMASDGMVKGNATSKREPTPRVERTSFR